MEEAKYFEHKAEKIRKGYFSGENFEDLAISSKVKEAVIAMGFTKMTDIQVYIYNMQ